jgi:hypothetical protein
MAFIVKSNVTVSNLRVGPLSGGGGSGIPIETSGLQLYYDFGNTSSYSGTGTTLTDLSGNGLTGAFHNNYTFTSDGASSFIKSPNSTNYLAGITATGGSDLTSYTYPFSNLNLSGDVEFTLMMLVRLGNTTIYTERLLTIRNEGYHNDFGMDLSYYGAGSLSDIRNTFYASFDFTNDGGGRRQFFDEPSGYDIQNDWINITVTTGRANGIKMYFDGVLGQETNTSRDNNLTPFPGNFDENNQPGIILFTFGNQDESINAVALYNRELSASEVLANYNALSSRF